MADTLTPEEKKRLTEELTKYAAEGASDDDLRQFRDAFISELKKKGVGNPLLVRLPRSLQSLLRRVQLNQHLMRGIQRLKRLNLKLR